MDAVHAFLVKRLEALEIRLHAACARAGRSRESVKLVAVTKAVSAEVAGLLPRLGVLDLGESRPQELWRKAAQISAPVRWHLIGHLQRNKIERTVPLTHLIHSVDSVRLLKALDAEAARQQRTPDMLLEVNASGEASKHGFRPQELALALDHLEGCRHVRVRGLMTMAAFSENPEDARRTFAAVRTLRDNLSARLGPPHELRELSMGMTNDFEVAVEEGATLVRVGSAIFEGIPDPAEGL